MSELMTNEELDTAYEVYMDALRGEHGAAWVPRLFDAIGREAQPKKDVKC